MNMYVPTESLTLKVLNQVVLNQVLVCREKICQWRQGRFNRLDGGAIGFEPTTSTA